MCVKRNILALLFVGITGVIICLPTACKKNETEEIGIGPFSNGSKDRNMIVVISDLHLGADLAYSETNKNLKPLEDFLGLINKSPNVKELVIAGDMLDEWFIPGTKDPYNGKDQADFVQRIAVANKGVIDAFNRIIKAGKVRVTYVPGNHDLTITAENVERILPGINQARDNQGLGTYSPANFSEIAIEHGHRYNFFCAPDPISNQEIAPGTITPPGYFFTRVAALHVIQDCHILGDAILPVTANTSGDISQNLLFGYWKVWAWALNELPVENKFDEKIIVTNVDGFTGTYSVNDLFPYQSTAGGFIDVNLYKGIQDTWEQRQTLNNVAVKFPASRAIANVIFSTETDNQAQLQYFTNPESNKRLVVFGHSHTPIIKASENHQGLKSIYANAGTWIDDNPDRKTMTFVVITPQNEDDISQTYVKLYNFEDEIPTEMAIDSLQF